MSSIFHFRQPDPSQPLRAAIFGDLSIIKGQQSIDQLIEATKQNQLDVIIHIGDLAYDLHDENGATGDDYMNAIEPFAAYVPYMVSTGRNGISVLNTFSSLAICQKLENVVFKIENRNNFHCFKIALILKLQSKCSLV